MSLQGQRSEDSQKRENNFSPSTPTSQNPFRACTPSLPFVHTVAYCYILLHTLAYSSILLHTVEHSCTFLHTVKLLLEHVFYHIPTQVGGGQ